MKIIVLVLLVLAGHSYGEGWVENGQFRYDFGNDYLNNNTRFGKAMPKHHWNNSSQIVIQPIQIKPQVPQPKYHYYHQPKRRYYDKCVGAHCLNR